MAADTFHPRQDYRKMIWVELLAFNPSEPDFGAGPYLEAVGFQPDAIFLDLRYIDFVNLHERGIDDSPLDYKYCANYERPGGHIWTPRQLRGLVDELQNRGVTVYFSQMSTLCTDLLPDSKPLDTKLSFILNHPELVGRGAFGEMQKWMNPLKRFRDGSFYEDFFVSKLSEVLEDYGFGGFFGADAMIHLYGSVSQSDYSDDMVAQFSETTGLNPPPDLRGDYDCEPESFHKRLDWIRKHHRLEWIRFYTQRWARFWQKVVEVCHTHGVKVIVNDAIQTDPFEALYRFGCDYRLIADTGVDGMILQTNSGSAELLLGFSDHKVNHDWVEKMVAHILTTKAQVPHLPLYFLCCIQDAGEKWDTLRFAPPLLEKEMLSYCATYYVDEKGKVSHCLDGTLFCLGDGISRDEWKWLKGRCDLAFSTLPPDTESLPGVTAVWMPEAVDNQLATRCAEPEDAPPSAHRLLWDLLAAGLPVRSITPREALHALRRPLLLLNPAYADNTSLAVWEDCRKSAEGILAEVGRLSRSRAEAPAPVAELRLVRDDGEEVTWGRIFALDANSDEVHLIEDAVMSEAEPGCRVEAPQAKDSAKDSVATVLIRIPPTSMQERASAEAPTHWSRSIPFEDLPVALLRNFTSILNSLDDLNIRTSSGRPFAVCLSERLLRLFVSNEDAFYQWVDVSMEPRIKSVATLTGFPRVPILKEEHTFLVQIPPRGMALLEIEIGFR